MKMISRPMTRNEKPRGPRESLTARMPSTMRATRSTENMQQGTCSSSDGFRLGNLLLAQRDEQLTSGEKLFNYIKHVCDSVGSTTKKEPVCLGGGT
ncbi:hypothetical protein [Paraburkholderia dinghuensis]|uniref:Uncharacterized protein n=1 Tax=Paraburkholderia dinghuensis TaxID=2305225 RepID=A0A3N6NZY5_9BURK|nr:hypothetical protein [Paraburkholderia dinghuensis]RQH06543.1 hypothetical protein D1Y85_11725 [Paraburkholderia dinghuensis]